MDSESECSFRKLIASNGEVVECIYRTTPSCIISGGHLQYIYHTFIAKLIRFNNPLNYRHDFVNTCKHFLVHVYAGTQ